MFTGLVEGLGVVTAIEEDGPGVELAISPSTDLKEIESTHIGDSIAINGCCLTVIRNDGESWWFQAGSETLSRTNLGKFEVGTKVNLERSLRANDRLGGHFVQGHVDGVGTVDEIIKEGDWIHIWFKVEHLLTRQMVPKGSVTVDGVSLTLVEVEDDRFSVALIPHTLEVTTLGLREVGQRVNIETDIIGKYMEKMLGNVRPPQQTGGDHV